jgi:hypothetical protein
MEKRYKLSLKKIFRPASTTQIYKNGYVICERYIRLRKFCIASEYFPIIRDTWVVVIPNEESMKIEAQEAYDRYLYVVQYLHKSRVLPHSYSIVDNRSLVT